MPGPTNERQALEREREELPAHLANYQRELDATPPEHKERRERLTWQIRRVQKRMAEVEEGHSGSNPLSSRKPSHAAIQLLATVRAAHAFPSALTVTIGFVWKAFA